MGRPHGPTHCSFRVVAALRILRFVVALERPDRALPCTRCPRWWASAAKEVPRVNAVTRAPRSTIAQPIALTVSHRGRYGATGRPRVARSSEESLRREPPALPTSPPCCAVVEARPCTRSTTRRHSSPRRTASPWRRSRARASLATGPPPDLAGRGGGPRRSRCCWRHCQSPQSLMSGAIHRLVRLQTSLGRVRQQHRLRMHRSPPSPHTRHRVHEPFAGLAPRGESA
jgi:hypothetical protein